VNARCGSSSGSECWDLVKGEMLEYFLAVYNNPQHPTLFKSGVFSLEVFSKVLLFPCVGVLLFPYVGGASIVRTIYNTVQ
jgi:hypothetical protein